MPIYTFYPCKADGDATSFDAADLGSDAHARIHALRVLAEHASCSHVVVWLGDRQVLTCERDAPPRGPAPCGPARRDAALVDAG